MKKNEKLTTLNEQWAELDEQWAEWDKKRESLNATTDIGFRIIFWALGTFAFLMLIAMIFGL